MPELEMFQKMVRRYYKQKSNAEGRKITQLDLANKLSLNEEELGKRLRGYHHKKTGRVWSLTAENVLDIVLALAEWEAVTWEQAVELLTLMDYPLNSPHWKTKLQKYLSPPASSFSSSLDHLHFEHTEAQKRWQHEQADKISSWIAATRMPPSLPVKLSNQSGDPVYDVIISVVLVQGSGPQDGRQTFMQKYYKVLPPGTFLISIDNYPGGGMGTKPGTELAFTDKAGLHWLKDKYGKLHSLNSKSPQEYYELGLPIGWSYIDDSK